MQRHRVLFAFGVAWLTAVLLSWWVYKRTTATVSRDLVFVVAAARDLKVGTPIAAADLKLVSLDRKDLPEDAHLKTSDVADRAVITPVAASELVLERKLAPKGSGGGLTALIEPGMRAVSVQVNEITGVSGFIQPGTRVDVLFTRTFSNGDAATTTILQNAKVIAYGRELEPGAKLDAREASKPTVATLLVSQWDAEKLALAMQRGRIQFVLRNPLDEEVTDGTEPVGTADLGIEDPSKNAARREPPPVPSEAVVKAAVEAALAEQRAQAAAQADNDKRVVRVYRGSKVSEETFE